MIGTIIKPSVGLDPEATAAQVAGLLDAGIDFIKDDELQSDGPACPFEARVAAVMRVINDHAERTGKKVMYAANLTGDIDEQLTRSEEHTSGTPVTHAHLVCTLPLATKKQYHTNKEQQQK